jgi:quercetin dioxygenase-like cupin family protein
MALPVELQGILAVCGAGHVIPILGEVLRKEITHALFIVDDQQVLRLFFAICHRDSLLGFLEAARFKKNTNTLTAILSDSRFITITILEEKKGVGMPFIQLSDNQEREMFPGFRARFVHADRMTWAYWTIEAGATLPEHNHPHEQVSNIVRGRFEMTLDGKTQTIEPGSVAVIPSGVRHSGRALTDCFIIDVFSPAREDYR